jgi:hypothetical protein
MVLKKKNGKPKHQSQRSVDSFPVLWWSPAVPLELKLPNRRFFKSENFQRTGTGGFQKSKEPPNTGLGATAVKQNDFFLIIFCGGGGVLHLLIRTAPWFRVGCQRRSNRRRRGGGGGFGGLPCPWRCCGCFWLWSLLFGDYMLPILLQRSIKVCSISLLK